MRVAARSCVLLLAGLALVPAGALAQGIAQTLDELRLLTRVGETVAVTDSSGLVTRGRISSLSPAAIGLDVAGQPRTWQDADITRISQRRGDSLGNGALWGLGIGAGLMTVAVAAAGVEDGDEGWAVLAIGFYGGVGAGIGVGIDALIKTTQVIYERPATATTTGQNVPTSPAPSTRWHVVPLVSPRAQGARITVRF